MFVHIGCGRKPDRAYKMLHTVAHIIVVVIIIIIFGMTAL
jgi:hypothetical protein